MIKIPVDMSRLMPITRETASLLAAAAERYSCTLTLENNGVVLNMKSMIGLLSQSIPKDGHMVLIAEGEDEEAAVKEIRTIIGA